VQAICVEQLLAAGARCEGKTITDEIAFSLLGENHFYGTPLNPRAPDRVPGGSSSGSASAVACGLVDFALGTDTGGSVRVPASNCGIWGLRPSHGRISVAGVMPLSPTLDTVGIFARDVNILERAAAVLLPDDERTDSTPATIHLVQDAFELAGDEAERALEVAVDHARRAFGERIRTTSLGDLLVEKDATNLDNWLTIYRVLQGTEMMSCLGHWIDGATPEFGPAPTAGLEFVRKLDRTRIGESVERRERFCRLLGRVLGAGDVLCLPSAPTIAPLKGSRAFERNSNYYRHTLSLTAIAGVGRLPQVSMPLADVAGVPIGLSLAGAWGTDRQLLRIAKKVAES
jgi:amidase